MTHVRSFGLPVFVCALTAMTAAPPTGGRVAAAAFSRTTLAARSGSPSFGYLPAAFRRQDTPARTAPADVAGATNFTRLDANFASGGVTTPEAFAAIRQLGFRTVVNLRTASEAGADIEGEAKTVERAGLKYISLPFSTTAPDVTTIDKFLDIAKDAGTQPVYIHCFSGQRANAFWMIKRVLVDGWTTEKALAEADALKMTSQRLREIATAYVKDHAK